MSGQKSANNPTDALIERLGALHPKKIDLSLGRLEKLLDRLGNPERKLPPTIHVAGTNGKGSTVAFLRAILEAAGKGVHVYTSPSLVRFHERIRLAQKSGSRIVDDERLLKALSAAEKMNDGDEITFFEITTAAALLLFAQESADILLLETGLGGRLDATNVIEKPLASVITPISIDHTEHLGPTLEAIAGEKAGILKRGAPAIIARQEPGPLKVLERTAAKLGIKTFISGEQWNAHEERGRLV
jgi:dihydrofolate synthase/folylpolyglutamate synthase